MSFHGFNRAAINAGVVSFVAGAALLTASSTVKVAGTRTALPATSVTLNSNVVVTGVRNCFGGAGFVSAVTGSAFPALLFLQFADVHVTSNFTASYTDALSKQEGLLSTAGLITRPGEGNAVVQFSATAIPLVKAGFATVIKSAFSANADASVQRNGNSTVDRDGYAKHEIQSSLYANGLKTALSDAYFSGNSYSEVTPLKTHGGAANFDSVFKIRAVPSADRGISKAHSTFYADGLLTQAGQSLAVWLSSFDTNPLLTRYGQLNKIELRSDGWAIPRMGVLAQSSIVALGSATSLGFITKMGAANTAASFSSQANGFITKYGAANCQSQASTIASPYVNAAVDDPPNRTMRRIGVDRVMRRPFVNREMRRQV